MLESSYLNRHNNASILGSAMKKESEVQKRAAAAAPYHDNDNRRPFRIAA